MKIFNSIAFIRPMLLCSFLFFYKITAVYSQEIVLKEAKVSFELDEEFWKAREPMGLGLHGKEYRYYRKAYKDTSIEYLFPPELTVMVEDIHDSETLESYMKLHMKQLKVEMQQFEDVTARFKIRNITAKIFKTAYLDKESGLMNHGYLVFLINNGFGLMFRYEKLLPLPRQSEKEFKKIVASLKQK